MQPTDPQAQNLRCSSWEEIARALEKFGPPEVTIDDKGEVSKPNGTWVFRGLKRACYELKPAIEREAQSKSMEWPALERFVLDEFKSRARIHLGALSVPEDELSWLALMQHYTVPTRLLDFTYSPFVALYFAVSPEDGTKRGNPGNKCDVRVWAINAEAVKSQFSAVAWRALAEERKRLGMRTSGRVGLGMEDQVTDRDSMITEIDEFRAQVAGLLSYPRTCRTELHQHGCVCPASPPAFNPRFASQQGVFLLNFEPGFSFNQSLNKMMARCTNWCKTFDIDAGATSEIEQRLFQMNIHEHSLFPDMEGLAGLIRQKIRLHCK
jgi:hypothetical protein